MTTSSALSLATRIPLISGHSIPQLGLGTWRSPPGLVQSAVTSALLTGYRHLDCAWTYENEAEIGAALHSVYSSTPITRSDLFITSKVWNNQQLPHHLIACCQDSLQRLGTDYLDLYLLHWPVAFKLIPGNKFAENETKTDRYYEDVSRESVWRAMESLVDMGLVRSIGVSNHTYEQVLHLLSFARIPPCINQVEAHPYFNQSELRAQLAHHGIPLEAYCPLGNLQRDDSDREATPLKDPVIARIAERVGKSVAQVILRWHLQLSHVVIPKSSNTERIKENAELYGWELSEADMEAINALGVKNRRFSNPPFLPGWKTVFGDK